VAQQPGERPAQQQEDTDLGDSQGDGGQRGRVEIGAPVPGHADGAHRIAGDQHEGRQGRGAVAGERRADPRAGGPG
jgi:hypothetical protein